MLVDLGAAFPRAHGVHADMSGIGTYRLTHPELLTESELRDALESSCIDCSHFGKMSKAELLETYKRVAMPLPQRGNDADGKEGDSEGSERNFDSSNSTCNLKRNSCEDTKSEESKQPESPAGDCKQTPKKIRLTDSKSGIQCNGTDKRPHDGRHEESPSKKRQKITWP